MLPIDFSKKPEISRELDLSIYTRKALAETQMAFRDFCRTTARPLSSTRLILSITPIGDASENTQRTFLEFWNYLLDKSSQERLS